MSKKYKSNFLSEVICRIDFTKEIDQSDQCISQFQDSIKSSFPIRKDVDETIIIANVSDKNLSQEKKIVKRQEYFSADEKNSLILSAAYMVFDYKKYDDFDTFYKNEFIPSIKNFIRIYGDLTTKYVGLRYINLITFPEGNPFEWKEYIDSNLIASIDFVKDKKSLRRSLQAMEFNKGNRDLRFQFGLFNSEYPNVIARKEFALDYDCHTFEQMNLESTISIINIFNTDITKLFEDSITDGLRSKMGVIEGV